MLTKLGEGGAMAKRGEREGGDGNKTRKEGLQW